MGCPNDAMQGVGVCGGGRAGCPCMRGRLANFVTHMETVRFIIGRDSQEWMALPRQQACSIRQTCCCLGLTVHPTMTAAWGHSPKTVVWEWQRDDRMGLFNTCCSDQAPTPLPANCGSQVGM
eukprot:363419-Chlamydomonas_euryale.AAC.2